MQIPSVPYTCPRKHLTYVWTTSGRDTVASRAGRGGTRGARTRSAKQNHLHDYMGEEGVCAAVGGEGVGGKKRVRAKAGELSTSRVRRRRPRRVFSCANADGSDAACAGAALCCSDSATELSVVAAVSALSVAV